VRLSNYFFFWNFKGETFHRNIPYNKSRFGDCVKNNIFQAHCQAKLAPVSGFSPMFDANNSLADLHDVGNG